VRFKRSSPPPLPANALEALRQAEQYAPGMKEEIARRGYTEEQMAELIERRLASSEIGSLRRGPRIVLPSQYPRGALGLIVLFGILGYFGLAIGNHGGAQLVRSGWWGALYGAGVMVGVNLVTEIVGRIRKRRAQSAG
jgi:hypothetical protein